MKSWRVGAGALCWLTALQFYLVEWLVSRSWRAPAYHYASDAISELGATRSPAHTAMNLSFLGLGIAIALGGALLGRTLRGVRWLAVPAGLGVIIVGLCPEDTVGAVHSAGAAVFFVAGNAGLLLTGRRLARSGGPAGAVLVAAGGVGLVATVAFATGGWGLVHAVGTGIVERTAGYPVSAGYALAGLWSLRYPL